LPDQIMFNHPLTHPLQLIMAGLTSTAFHYRLRNNGLEKNANLINIMARSWFTERKLSC